MDGHCAGIGNMKILIPMAGEGKRFQEAGYSVSKPAIPTWDVRYGMKLPMVVCAVNCLPGLEDGGKNLIFVERDFHRLDGTEDKIHTQFPQARFLTVAGLTEGQACTCLLAKDWIDGDEELLIAGCDNGMLFNEAKFHALRQEADLLVFTYRNNDAVMKNPDAYGWMKTDGDGNITGLSIKKALSDTPKKDHAVVATFWFRHGWQFVRAAEKMISEGDRIHNEFYVDETVKHALELGYRAKVFEVERYIGWGTPKDYEEYQATFEYWRGFAEKEGLL